MLAAIPGVVTFVLCRKACPRGYRTGDTLAGPARGYAARQSRYRLTEREVLTVFARIPVGTPAIERTAFRKKTACSRCFQAIGLAPPIRDTQRPGTMICADSTLICPVAGRAEVAYLGSSEIGYSLRVRGLLGAGSRSLLPRRFLVIFAFGRLIP